MQRASQRGRRTAWQRTRTAAHLRNLHLSMRWSLVTRERCRSVLGSLADLAGELVSLCLLGKLLLLHQGEVAHQGQAARGSGR